MVIDSRGEAEAGSGLIVDDIAFFRVLSGSEGAVNGDFISFSYNNSDLLEIGFQTGVSRGGNWRRDIADATPFLAGAIGKICLFGADSTANGCGSSWRF